MKQKISTERLFPLGNYKNVKFSDEITEIPQELMLNNAFQNELRKLQFTRIHKTFYEYLEQAKTVLSLDYEDAMALLDELETETVTKLQDLLPNGKLKEDTKDILEA